MLDDLGQVTQLHRTKEKPTLKHIAKSYDFVYVLSVLPHPGAHFPLPTTSSLLPHALCLASLCCEELVLKTRPKSTTMQGLDLDTHSRDPSNQKQN